MGAGRLLPLGGDRILLHNVIVSAGNVLAGFLGFAFQAVISHQLEPSHYGAVFAVITLITLIGLPASAVSLLMAREASQDRANGRNAASGALLRDGNRILLVVGSALAIVLLTTSPWLSSFLNVPIELLLATVVGIPFTLALPLLLGELQGEQRFAAFSSMAVGQAGLKLVAAVSFGLLFGPVGVVLGVSLAGAISYLIVRGLLRRKLGLEARWPWQSRAISYLTIVLPSTLALAVLLSADILLVKHFFPARMAGEYGAVAALGRAIFWGGSGIAAVAFPKMVFRESQGRTSSLLLLLSLCLVILGGGAGLAIITVGSRTLLRAFAGEAYLGGALYLPWYALGMTLLGAAAVLIATHQSRGKRMFLSVLVPIAVLEPALIVLFHGSLMQVILILDFMMAVLVLGLFSLYLVDQRRETSARFGTKAVAVGGKAMELIR